MIGFHPMKTTLILIALAVFATTVFTISKEEQAGSSVGKTAMSYLDIAQAIKATYDQQLDGLTDYQASHYAARIYRISGDTGYLEYNLHDLRSMIEEAEKLLQIAQDNAEIEYSGIRADGWSASARARLRRQSLIMAPDYPYYLRSLGLLRRTLEYRVCSPQFEQLKAHVLAHDYAPYFGNPFMIETWAAQLANTVVWIKQLGGEDYSAILIDTMRTTYPDEQDYLLSAKQYENKLYGYTHFILASSQYYQYPVNRADFAWIFDYFDAHIDTIITRAKADVIAEVGISYVLARELDHPALEKTKQSIAQQFHALRQMIPGKNEDFDIPIGSHRNILSIILLSSPQKLYPGPWLGEISEIAQCEEGSDRLANASLF